MNTISTIYGEEETVTHYCKKCKTIKPIFDFETRVRGKCGEKPLNQCKTCRKKEAAQLAYLKKYNNSPNTDYVCPLCLRGKENLGYTSAFVLDHDHTSGEARGWICHDCNNALDRMGDNANTARRMVEYLENTDRSPWLS